MWRPPKGFLATSFFFSLLLFIFLFFPLALDWVELSSASQIYPSCSDLASLVDLLGEYAEGALYCIVGVGLYPRETKYHIIMGLFFFSSLLYFILLSL